MEKKHKITIKYFSVEINVKIFGRAASQNIKKRTAVPL
jgi:hypothetical protein